MSKKQTYLENFFVNGKRPSEETEEDEPMASEKKKTAFNRQYQESDLLKYGFIETGDSCIQSVFCIICGEQLSDEAIKLSKLLHHLDTEHPALKDKPLKYFERERKKHEQRERKKREQEEQKQLSGATASTNTSALITVSYKLAHFFAKANEPPTIGEELILPATISVLRLLLGEAAANEIAQVPLSASIVTQRTEEIAEDIETQLLERINTSPWYALQVDGFTEMIDCSILLVYVRYIYQEDVHEDILCVLSLPTKITATELFNSLDGYISGKLKWSFCVGICTGEAAAKTELLYGLTARLKEVAPECAIDSVPRTAMKWIHDPFVNKPGESSMSAQEEDQLLEIAHDGSLKTFFETTTLPAFWSKVVAEYSEIATTALKTLLPFPTSCLCEMGFSAVEVIKTKFWSRMDINNTLRVSLSPIIPRWDLLVAEKEAQGSH